MLTPQYLMSAADPIVEKFSELEQGITTEICRLITKIGSTDDVAKWQEAKRREFGRMTVKADALITKTETQSRGLLNGITNDAVNQALATDNAIYAAAGIETASVSASPVQQAILLQGAENTAALLKNYTQTTALITSNAFLNALDGAYLQVITGASDYASAIRNAVNALASLGIHTSAYPTGSHISIEAGIRRAILTGLNQSVGKLQLARAEEYGCELVETSSHAGARPSHAEWQGRVFCIKGHHRHYPDFYRETGYGTGEGLCGWNCYHNFYPFFEGLSTHSFSTDPSADAGRDNDEDYRLQQRQRELERAIRDAKRRVQALDGARDGCPDPDLHAQLDRDFDNASALLKQREARLKAFLEQHGRTRNPDREQIGLWNRSISAKAVWGGRRAGTP